MSVRRPADGMKVAEMMARVSFVLVLTLAAVLLLGMVGALPAMVVDTVTAFLGIVAGVVFVAAFPVGFLLDERARRVRDRPLQRRRADVS